MSHHQTKRRIFHLSLCCAAIMFLFILLFHQSYVGFEKTSMILKIFNDNQNILVLSNQTTTINNISKEGGKLIKSRKNIFFLETSHLGDGEIVLTPRKACAIESAAKMNPGFNIYLLTLSPLNLKSDSSQTLVSQIQKYKNVFIGQIIMDNYVKSTLLEDWWNFDKIKSSKWPESHMSDILRYLTLWKYGGIYLDLDFVVISSLEHLTNFAGAEDSSSVNSAAIGFSLDEMGRKIVGDCLEDLRNHFRGDVWINNGPGVITRVLNKLCNTANTEKMTKERCHGFDVFPPSAFYPIHYSEWMRYFTKVSFDDSMKKINKSLGIHLWNYLSKNEVIKVGSQVPYAVIANEYCPKVYKNCGKFF